MREHQDSLFDDDEPLPPHQRKSRTSRAAAIAIAPKAGTYRAKVLAWLRERGEEGATDEEGIDATGLASSTYRPRRIECWKGGLVADSGRTRRVRSGKMAVVWIAVLQAVASGTRGA